MFWWGFDNGWQLSANLQVAALEEGVSLEAKLLSRYAYVQITFMHAFYLSVIFFIDSTYTL